MKFFGWAPDSNTAANPGPRIAPPGLAFSIFYGSVSFSAVSVLAYSIWAYRLINGAPAMYTAIAAVFVVLSGVALSRLVAVQGAWKRFPFLHAVAFVAYAVCWCIGWFVLKGKFHGDLWGSAAGLAAMTWIIQSAFGKKVDFLPTFAVLFSFHSLGYYLGGDLHAMFRGSSGQLLYGAAHGLGFGAGLGYLLFNCQTRTPAIRE